MICAFSDHPFLSMDHRYCLKLKFLRTTATSQSHWRKQHSTQPGKREFLREKFTSIAKSSESWIRILQLKSEVYWVIFHLFLAIFTKEMILLLIISQLNLICITICTSEVFWTWSILARRQCRIILEVSPNPAFFALTVVFMAHDMSPLTFIRSIIFLLTLSNNCFQWHHSSTESLISSL